MSSRKDWKPDLGFYLAGQDLAGRTFALPGFPMDSLAVLDPGEYSMGANTSIDGQEYAATFDFGQPVFEGMLETMPGYMADGLRSMVMQLDEFPAVIRFPDPVMLVIEAHLGTVVHGDGEDFMPLIADSIKHLG